MKRKNDLVDLSLIFNKRKILKYFGNKNPFTTVTEKKRGEPLLGRDDNQDVDFYGVVTFEITHKEVVGMEFTNMLIENSSRFVFEASKITKRSFQNVQSFFNYYKLDP